MGDRLLSAEDAAALLGIKTATLSDWLAQSNAGDFGLRGEHVTINDLQGGPRGQQRILIERRETERLRELMRVRPRPKPARRPPTRRPPLRHITGPIGRPDDGD